MMRRYGTVEKLRKILKSGGWDLTGYETSIETSISDRRYSSRFGYNCTEDHEKNPKIESWEIQKSKLSHELLGDEPFETSIPWFLKKLKK